MSDEKRQIRILGISGGRPDSNNDALCKQALSAASSRGAEISFVRLADLTIRDCRGCFSCTQSMTKHGLSRCVIRDDFDWLREKMLEADGIIFSLPVFRLGAPAAFLRLIERFGIRDDIGRYLLQMEGSAPPADKRILRPRPVIYMGTAGTDLTSRFDADCRLFSTVTMWPAAEVILFDWTRSVFGEKEKLDRAGAAGRRLAALLAGNEDSSQAESKGICPHCHGDNIKIRPDSLRVECCSCGLTGKLGLRDERPVFLPESGVPSHCFGTAEGKRLHTRDVDDNNVLRAQMQKQPEWQENKRYFQKMRIFPQRPPADGADDQTEVQSERTQKP